MTLQGGCHTIPADLYKKEHKMFRKYRVIKSVDNEGRKVITYIKNNLDIDHNGKLQPISAKEGEDKIPEALQMTVRLP